MFGPLGNSKNDEDVVVLRDVEPYACGGTRATQNRAAPTEILSDEMVYFSVNCSFTGCIYISPDGKPDEGEKIRYISAYAAPCEKGVLVYLKKVTGSDDVTVSIALIKDGVFPRLTELVRECDLAKSNGFHSQTYGLPANFGGDVDIRYSDGERISFSNNQSPVIGLDTARKIARVFEDALDGESIPIPDLSGLREILFEEKRPGGGFTNADLIISDDGTAKNVKSMRFDDPTVYRSEKELGADTVDAIKSNIRNGMMTAWPGLPSNGFTLGIEKSLTFIFEDGNKITVFDGLLLPEGLGKSFFNVELEMTVNN
ncbi:MAG: hypothetical protein IJS45_00360 [Clostridia bacterium]|nr:hypothetical protein [Clostridia bacterium]